MSSKLPDLPFHTDCFDYTSSKSIRDNQAFETALISLGELYGLWQMCNGDDHPELQSAEIEIEAATMDMRRALIAVADSHIHASVASALYEAAKGREGLSLLSQSKGIGAEFDPGRLSFWEALNRSLNCAARGDFAASEGFAILYSEDRCGFGFFPADLMDAEDLLAEKARHYTCIVAFYKRDDSTPSGFFLQWHAAPLPDSRLDNETDWDQVGIVLASTAKVGHGVHFSLLPPQLLRKVPSRYQDPEVLRTSRSPVRAQQKAGAA